MGQDNSIAYQRAKCAMEQGVANGYSLEDSYNRWLQSLSELCGERGISSKVRKDYERAARVAYESLKGEEQQ